jgi:geranylgeranyl pyrophosphate synthase
MTDVPLCFHRIDDVLDNDTERRGSAATHLVFEVGHTISTALVTYGKIAELALNLSEKACLSLLGKET